MRILIDIGHPAHVHYFKNFIRIMEDKGHKFFVTARDRDCIQDLLKQYDIQYVNRGKGATSRLGKLFYILKADLLLLWYSLKFKPDIYLSHFSIYTAHAATILRKKCIMTGDTDSNTSHKYSIPFISAFLSPSCFQYNYGKKQVFFNSFMELMYLHPNYFTPNMDTIKNIIPNNNKKNVLFRFVSWNAHHDTGMSGISMKIRKELITTLEPYCNIFISSENELDDSLKKYQLHIDPHLMHDFLASIDFLLAESATMSSECAVMGTPAIYYDAKGRCYTKEEDEVYNLVWNFEDTEGIVERALKLAQTDNLKELVKLNHGRLLNDKIDPTAFLVWFIENYPDSHKIMISNPEYQNKFKQ